MFSTVLVFFFFFKFTRPCSKYNVVCALRYCFNWYEKEKKHFIYLFYLRMHKFLMNEQRIVSWIQNEYFINHKEIKIKKIRRKWMTTHIAHNTSIHLMIKYNENNGNLLVLLLLLSSTWFKIDFVYCSMFTIPNRKPTH